MDFFYNIFSAVHDWQLTLRNFLCGESFSFSWWLFVIRQNRSPVQMFKCVAASSHSSFFIFFFNQKSRDNRNLCEQEFKSNEPHYLSVRYFWTSTFQCHLMPTRSSSSLMYYWMLTWILTFDFAISHFTWSSELQNSGKNRNLIHVLKLYKQSPRYNVPYYKLPWSGVFP